MASWGGCSLGLELAGKQLASRTAGAALIICRPGRCSASSQQHELILSAAVGRALQPSLPAFARKEEFELSRLCPMSKGQAGHSNKTCTTAAQMPTTGAVAPAVQVKSIIGTLEEALPTPSHAVQDAVSGCLAPSHERPGARQVLH